MTQNCDKYREIALREMRTDDKEKREMLYEMLESHIEACPQCSQARAERWAYARQVACENKWGLCNL